MKMYPIITSGLSTIALYLPYVLGAIGVVLLALEMSKRKRKKDQRQNVNQALNLDVKLVETLEFEAEIIDKRPAYVRGRDSVLFRSRFTGRLTNGYFEYKISAKIPAGVHTYTAYRFRPGTPHVESSYRYVVLNHPKTMTAWSDGIRGKLIGDVDTGWLSMSWKIPDDVRLGAYVIEMSVVDNYHSYTPSYQTIARTFNIIDPDSSHHNRFEGVSIGD
jgi:hypothetical protein